MYKRILTLLVVLIAFNSKAFAFDIPWSDAHKMKKLQEKQEKETEPMVQTVDEWLERATDIRMEHRQAGPYKEEPNPNLVEKLDLPTFFEKYNSAPGSRELNLERLKRDHSARSMGVISPDFKQMAYTECYYHPSDQQTSSAFYIHPLDTTKSKKARVIEANVFAGARKEPLISSTNETLNQYLFSTFTVVDWSKDSQRVLLKEKIGSQNDGIYKTIIWTYQIPADNHVLGDADTLKTLSYKSFENLNDEIKNYWSKKEGFNLNRYRWDVKPLGFLAADENVVIAAAYTFDTKYKEHIFLGTWSLNVETGEVALLSESAADSFEISTNGLVLVKRLP